MKIYGVTRIRECKYQPLQSGQEIKHIAWMLSVL